MKKELEEMKKDKFDNEYISDVFLQKAPKLIIDGMTEITIQNHKGIKKFEKNIIEINSKVGMIIIEGEQFEIIYIGTYTVIIGGKFKSIRYEEKII